MKLDSDADSCDLVICLYTVKDQYRVAIIKLDYRAAYNRSIEFEDDKFNIQMKLNEELISDTKKPKQCALVGLSGINDYYHLKLLDKDAEKEQIETKFVTDFLNAKKVEDDKYKTKVFKTTAENWITNAISDDMKKAEDIRSMLNYT